MKLKKLNLINQFYPKTHIKVNLKKEKKNTLVANCNFKGVGGGKKWVNDKLEKLLSHTFCFILE